jgi:hypothetical protein
MYIHFFSDVIIHVSHIYKTTHNIIIPCILIFIYLSNRYEHKNPELKGRKHLANFILHSLIPERNFILLRSIPKVHLLCNLLKTRSRKLLLVLASIVILGSESRWTHDRISLSHDSGSSAKLFFIFFP